MKSFRIIVRILVGIVFIFSGFVKAVDPLGSTYKFIDYFNAFGIGSLDFIAFPLAIILSTTELLLGVALLLGYRMKIASYVLLVFMSFFTVLTLISAITNPVTDCGCFGDALILTNWQTFWKNVFLMILTIFIFMNRSKFELRRKPWIEYLILSMVLLTVLILSAYCSRNLPVLDFRPYHTGTYIPDAMIVPEGAPEDVYETTLVYRNKETGKEQKFTMENFPRDDDNWEFVDSESELISRGYEPPIHDFSIYAPDGSDITGDILANSGYTLLLVSYDLDQADGRSLAEAGLYYKLSQALPELDFFALTASIREKIDTTRAKLKLEYDFYQVDEITLKTIIRSNPGLVLLHNGTIMAKWPYRQLPFIDDRDKLEDLAATFPFCKGCDLKEIDTPPTGVRMDEYQTFLYYRNLLSDSVKEFTINDFPRDPDVWVFEDSRTETIEGSFKAPLSGFNPLTSSGIEMREAILDYPSWSLLFIIKDITSISGENWQKILKLGGMASDYLGSDLQVFAMVPEEGGELAALSEQYLSTFEYLHLSHEFIEQVCPGNIMIAIINNSRVVMNSDENDIPVPEELGEIVFNSGKIDAGMLFDPLIIGGYADLAAKYSVLLIICIFLLFTLLLNIILNRNPRT